MITFLVGMWANPLFRRIMIYAAIAAGAWYALRLYRNHVFDEGYSKGKVEAVVDAEKAARQKFEAERQAIEAERRELDARVAAAEAAAAQIRRDRTALKQGLDQGIQTIKGELSARDQQVCDIPASELDGAIRDQLLANRNLESGAP